MANHHRQFEQRLRERGLRVTPERRAILDHVFRNFGHFDAETLLAALHADGVAVSRATVFRTLTHLVELGLLRRHGLGERKTFYEPASGRIPHEHLVCVHCGEILEFVREDLLQLRDEVCRQHRFRPLRYSLEIYGLCEACHEQRETAAPDAAGRSAAGRG